MSVARFLTGLLPDVETVGLLPMIQVKSNCDPVGFVTDYLKHNALFQLTATACYERYHAVWALIKYAVRWWLKSWKNIVCFISRLSKVSAALRVPAGPLNKDESRWSFINNFVDNVHHCHLTGTGLPGVPKPCQSGYKHAQFERVVMPRLWSFLHSGKCANSWVAPGQIHVPRLAPVQRLCMQFLPDLNVATSSDLVVRELHKFCDVRIPMAVATAFHAKLPYNFDVAGIHFRHLSNVVHPRVILGGCISRVRDVLPQPLAFRSQDYVVGHDAMNTTCEQVSNSKRITQEIEIPATATVSTQCEPIQIAIPTPTPNIFDRSRLRPVIEPTSVQASPLWRGFCKGALFAKFALLPNYVRVVDPKFTATTLEREIAADVQWRLFAGTPIVDSATNRVSAANRIRDLLLELHDVRTTDRLRMQYVILELVFRENDFHVDAVKFSNGLIPNDLKSKIDMLIRPSYKTLYYKVKYYVLTHLPWPFKLLPPSIKSG